MPVFQCRNLKYLLCYFASYCTCMCRFFAVMGKMFSFITSDVHNKLATLQHYLASDVGDHYRTVDKMIEYEVANGITVEPETSGR